MNPAEIAVHKKEILEKWNTHAEAQSTQRRSKKAVILCALRASARNPLPGITVRLPTGKTLDH
jgi:hypothetical protein